MGGLPLAAARKPLAVVHELPSAVGSLAEHGLEAHGFSSCCTGLDALQHVGSSQTRDQTSDLALAGVFLTTGPPGKPLYPFF